MHCPMMIAEPNVPHDDNDEAPRMTTLLYASDYGSKMDLLLEDWEAYAAKSGLQEKADKSDASAQKVQLIEMCWTDEGDWAL